VELKKNLNLIDGNAEVDLLRQLFLGERRRREHVVLEFDAVGAKADAIRTLEVEEIRKSGESLQRRKVQVGEIGFEPIGGTTSTAGKKFSLSFKSWHNINLMV
jgi:hypothetical protein